MRVVFSALVFAGLDPATHQLRGELLPRAMNTRVKPAYDGCRGRMPLFRTAATVHIHHPANGQWPFGRHLCKGAASQKKLKGSDALRAFSTKAGGRKHA
jgi:hypothetical protein